jgi:uncharacterized membrane protein YoaK (UPF0700 family)
MARTEGDDDSGMSQKKTRLVIQISILYALTIFASIGASLAAARQDRQLAWIVLALLAVVVTLTIRLLRELSDRQR